MSSCNCSHQFCKNFPVIFDFVTIWIQGVFLCSLCISLERISVRWWVDPRAIVRPERIKSIKNLIDPIGNPTSDVSFCSAVEIWRTKNKPVSMPLVSWKLTCNWSLAWVVRSLRLRAWEVTWLLCGSLWSLAQKKYTTGAKACSGPRPTCGGVAPVFPNLRYQKDVNGYFICSVASLPAKLL
jgi:hypothetical protein